MTADGRIPVVFVTGFLGSGKTTLIANILGQPGFNGTLVVVNEFGEVGIDHDLLEASSEDVVLLANGCLCCTIRGNLVDTLLDALDQVGGYRLRRFDRVVVETSGLADPAPVLGFLLGDVRWQARFKLAGVVTVCDGAAGVDALDRFPEAASQVRHADRIVITKGDIASTGMLDALVARLHRLNPDAERLNVDRGAIAAARILDLESVAAGASDVSSIDRARHDDEDVAEAVLRGHGVVRRTFTLPPLDRAALTEMVAALRAAAGPDVLRIKGLARLSDDARIAVIQGAMSSIAVPDLRPVRLQGPGRLVVLAQGEGADRVDRALAGLGVRSLASRNPPGARP